MKLPLLAALVLLAGCSSPVVPTTTAPSNLAPGQTRLVFQTSTGRALLSDVGFLTLALHALPAGETRYAAVPRAADGTYSLILEGLTAGDWQLSVRLYPTSEDPTLLFFADQREYLAPGTSNTIALKVYEPGTISGLTPTEAIVPTAIEVKNFNTAQLWTDPQTLSVGLPLRLAATLVDATAQTATDQRVEWSTSNPAAVTISPTGRVSPLQPGQAVLTAVSVANRNLSVSFTVTVQSSVVGYWKAADGTIVKIVPGATSGASHRISFVRPGPTNYQYETGPLSASGIDQYNILLNRQLSVLSAGLIDGPGYDGTLRDNRNGTLSLSGANLFPNTVFTRIVDPKPVTSVLVDVSNPAHLAATVLPADATIPTVLWASTNPAINAINPLTGVVTALSSGITGFYAFSLEDPAVLRQLWMPPAQGWMPSVSVAGPSAVTASNPVATFILHTTAAGPTSVQWLVDGRVVANRTDGSVAPLTYNTSNLSAGNHGLVVKVTDVTGSVHTSDAYFFTVRQVPQAVVSSMEHTLFLKPDGTLWGWGPNPYDELGLGGSTPKVLTPLYLDSNVAQVATGYSHSLYLKHDGTLWFMGKNGYGVSGDGDTTGHNQPVQVAAGSIQAIAAGLNQSWVLKQDGSLWATGENSLGTLGTGDTTNRSTFTKVLPNGGDSTPVAAVYPSPNDSTFVVKTDGSLWSTGLNNSGQLGDGFTGNRNYFFPTAFVDATMTGTILSVASGDYFTVVVTSTGQIWTTGADTFGQLGNGATVGNVLGFHLVATLPGVIKAAANGSTALLLKNDGTLYGTGRNNWGQIGDGSLTSRTSFTPVEVIRSSPVQDIFARYEGFYLLLKDGSLWGVGHGATEDGLTMGNGITIDQSAPVPITIGPAQEKVFASQNRTFIIKPDETLWAAGDNSFGTLGDGTTNPSDQFINITMGVFPSPNKYVAVAPGPDHTLFLKTDGSVWVVGSDSDQQQGNGVGVTNHPAPVQIMTNAKAIAAGDRFSLVVTQDGFVYGFGLNSGGQMGTLVSTPYFVVPLGITNGDHAVAVSAGADYGLILKADGTLLSAGVNNGNAHGQAGVPAPQKTEYTPVLTDVLAISAGWQHSTALKADRTLWVAGWNAVGQLGNGSTLDITAGYVTALDRVAAVSAGFQNTLVLKLDGTLWRTGLAPGTPATTTSVPVYIDEATTLAAGGYHSFFRKPDGTLWWLGSDGGNGNGITGPQTDTNIPQRVW